MSVAPLPVEAYRDLVSRALAEDIGGGDATSALTLEPGQRARGVLLAKSDLVLCGLEVFAEALRQCDPDVVVDARRASKDAAIPAMRWTPLEHLKYAPSLLDYQQWAVANAIPDDLPRVPGPFGSMTGAVTAAAAGA